MPTIEELNATAPYVVFDKTTGNVILTGETNVHLIPDQAPNESYRSVMVDELQDGLWRVVLPLPDSEELYAFAEICESREATEDETANAAARFRKLQWAAALKVDEGAEHVRSLFVTIGAGQAMVYQQKRIEAEAYLAAYATNPEAPNISDGEIPHIANEAAMNGISRYDQAVIVITMSEQWKAISSFIEERRLAAKQQVAAATTGEQIEAAANVDWSDILALAI